jgi:hypothetical protein
LPLPLSSGGKPIAPLARRHAGVCFKGPGPSKPPPVAAPDGAELSWPYIHAKNRCKEIFTLYRLKAVRLPKICFQFRLAPCDRPHKMESSLPTVPDPAGARSRVAGARFVTARGYSSGLPARKGLRQKRASGCAPQEPARFSPAAVDHGESSPGITFCRVEPFASFNSVQSPHAITLKPAVSAARFQERWFELPLIIQAGWFLERLR